MLQDTSIPLTDDGDNDLLDPNVSSGHSDALHRVLVAICNVGDGTLQRSFVNTASSRMDIVSVSPWKEVFFPLILHLQNRRFP